MLERYEFLKNYNIDKIDIYIDGSSSLNRYNAKYGGIGVYMIFTFQNETFEIDLRSIVRSMDNGLKVTNQICELLAFVYSAIIIMEFLELSYVNPDAKINFYSDSAYLINGWNNDWVSKWKQNSWKTSNNKSVCNKRLWEFIGDTKSYLKDIKISMIKVNGHSGNIGNDRADRLAVSAKELGFFKHPSKKNNKAILTEEDRKFITTLINCQYGSDNEIEYDINDDFLKECELRAPFYD